jgi:hypothetical protein
LHFCFVPFAKSPVWKHKVAKAATLWVKLQFWRCSLKAQQPG